MTALSVDPFRPSAVIRRYECGYFDGGARRGDQAAPIQTACFLHYVTQTVGDPERNRADPTDGLFKAGLGARRSDRDDGEGGPRVARSDADVRRLPRLWTADPG